MTDYIKYMIIATIVTGFAVFGMYLVDITGKKKNG